MLAKRWSGFAIRSFVLWISGDGITNPDYLKEVKF